MECVRFGDRGGVYLAKGLLCSKLRCPSSPVASVSSVPGRFSARRTACTTEEKRRAVDDVVLIGVDPHKASVTHEARDTREVLRASGTFPTTSAGYRAMTHFAHQWPRRVWAVEGARGVGGALVAG
jgi:hypothetical protein